MNNTIFSTPTKPYSQNWLTRRLSFGLTPATLMLMGVIILSALINFSYLDKIGDSNSYYTAAVKSMLSSWHNFFFISAEPGGSVTIDKPPLGLWIEAISAFFLGVSGFSVILPNILAGFGSVIAVYAIIKHRYSAMAGLVAALIMAVTPVAIAAQRNNTMDSLLTFTLVLATWAFLKATETNKRNYLFLGALLIGLGFMIKMMQAYLILPSVFALYFLGSSDKIGRKLIDLTLATLIIAVVSLWWPVVVDSVPADQRPYIGSSTDNTVMELIVGHNGLSRLFGEKFGGGNRTTPLNSNDNATDSTLTQNQDGFPAMPGGNQGGGMFSFEIGATGILRFFTPPLSAQLSWFLPLGLICLGVLLFRRISYPIGRDHQMVVLWGGWLLTCLVFFSIAGFFHSYYLIMMVPPLGAIVGIGVTRLWEDRNQGKTRYLLLVTAGITAIYQTINAALYGVTSLWLPLSLVSVVVGAIFLLVPRLRSRQWLGYATLLFSIIVIPFAWSVLTAQATQSALPSAYRGNNTGMPFNFRGRGNRPPFGGASSGEMPANFPPMGSGGFPGAGEGGFPPMGGGMTGGMNGERQINQALLTYLQEHTQEMKYLMAVPSSMIGSSYVLETGRPVLYLGGFGGQDPVIDADGIAKLVADKELRFLLLGGGGGPMGGGQEGTQAGIEAWAKQHCTAVDGIDLNQQTNDDATSGQSPAASAGTSQASGRGGFTSTLYDCATP